TQDSAACPYTTRFRAERNKLEEALAELRKGLSLNPDSWELNKAIATFYMYRGEVAQAVPHFEKAAAVTETDYHAWGMLMTCYYRSEERRVGKEWCYEM